MGFVNWYEKNQKRLASLAFAVGIAVVALTLLNRWPRETRFRFELDPQTSELDVRYVIDGGLVKAVRFKDDPLASSVTDMVSLAPGLYDIELDVLSSKGRFERSHQVTVPIEGVVVLSGEKP